MSSEFSAVHAGSIICWSQMVLTSEKKSKVPTTGYICDPLGHAGAELKS